MLKFAAVVVIFAGIFALAKSLMIPPAGMPQLIYSSIYLMGGWIVVALGFITWGVSNAKTK